MISRVYVRKGYVGIGGVCLSPGRDLAPLRIKRLVDLSVEYTHLHQLGSVPMMVGLRGTRRCGHRVGQYMGASVSMGITIRRPNTRTVRPQV